MTAWDPHEPGSAFVSQRRRRPTVGGLVALVFLVASFLWAIVGLLVWGFVA